MTLVIVIIIFALLFDFLNGFHDSANSIATVVATRVLKPRQAVIMAAFANLTAVVLFSTAVATTIGKEIVDQAAITSLTILAGLLSACLWNLITWYLGLPISSSHALIGGLIGATVITSGFKALIMTGIIKTVLFIVVAPLIGVIGGIVFTLLMMTIFNKKSSQKVLPFFAKLQLASSFFYSVGHGSNDAQKTMGIIALTLFTNGILSGNFYIPFWVIISSHIVIALGTYFGGWRIVKTMGMKLVHLRPFEGFCAETSSALTLFLSSFLGIPVSTTHVISGGIIGVGTAENYRRVKWINTRKIFLAWILTIPVALSFGVLISLFIKQIYR